MNQQQYEYEVMRELWEEQEAQYEMKQKQIEESRIRLEEMGIIFKDKE